MFEYKDLQKGRKSNFDLRWIRMDSIPLLGWLKINLNLTILLILLPINLFRMLFSSSIIINVFSIVIFGESSILPLCECGGGGTRHIQ